MTTSSVTSSSFGRASYPLNWCNDPDEFDFEEATKYYHDQITYHFDRICTEAGSTGSLIMGSSEVYFDIEDQTEISFEEVMQEASDIAYEETIVASENGDFDLGGE
ncbi:MAG: hypothetical protein CMC15_17680 [Flavobacteriaceae bacterium]|nr:hypothetical protein [Flavobacteriaceae bacterium]